MERAGCGKFQGAYVRIWTDNLILTSLLGVFLECTLEEHCYEKRTFADIGVLFSFAMDTAKPIGQTIVCTKKAVSSGTNHAALCVGRILAGSPNHGKTHISRRKRKRGGGKEKQRHCRCLFDPGGQKVQKPYEKNAVKRIGSVKEDNLPVMADDRKTKKIAPLSLSNALLKRD